MQDELIRKISDTYSIYKGPSEQSDSPEIIVYKIINTKTGVNEGETSVLPKALSVCIQLNEDLENINSALDSDLENISLADLEMDETIIN